MWHFASGWHNLPDTDAKDFLAHFDVCNILMLAIVEMNYNMDDLVRRCNMQLSDHDHHYIVLSFLHRWMISRALPVAHGTLLDFGAGGQPYRELFETKVVRYVAADVCPMPGRALDVTLEVDKPVPLADGAVNTILSSQTLEHVSDPNFYLQECRRLLAPDGFLILTVPMQWRHHETPHDYLRFTRFGITALLQRAGFIVDHLEGTGGVYALLGQILLNTLSERRVHRPWLFRLINRAALWLDRRYPDPEDTINWMCIAHVAKEVR